MTMRVGEKVIIVEEPDRECSMCGRLSECRPAGVDGAVVCFLCANKNPEALEAYCKRLFE